MKTILLFTLMASACLSPLFAQKAPKTAEMKKCPNVTDNHIMNSVTPKFISLAQYFVDMYSNQQKGVFIYSPDVKKALLAFFMHEFHGLWLYRSAPVKDSKTGEYKVIPSLPNDVTDFDLILNSQDSILQQIIDDIEETANAAKVYLRDSNNSEADKDALIDGLKGCGHHSIKRALTLP